MNANELADEFKEENNNWNEDNLRHWGKQTEAMLRQQQEKLTKYELRHEEQRKRIDELEAYQKHDVELAEAFGWDKGYEAGRQLGMKQERALWELAASTQEIMDTHPVAWINRDEYHGWLNWDKNTEMPINIPLYTHPVKELFKDAENRDELIGQEFETYLEKLTQDFKEGFKEGVLFCEDVARRPALYGQDTHPVKKLHLSLQKDKETGELLAVTYTDDEHRIVEVLWQKSPVKEHFEDEPQAEELHEIMQSNTKKGKRMNANELINKLKLVRCMAGDGQVLNEAETMILQQQAEIEALKADNEQMCKALFKATRAILRKASEK